MSTSFQAQGVLGASLMMQANLAEDSSATKYYSLY